MNIGDYYSTGPLPHFRDRTVGFEFVLLRMNHKYHQQWLYVSHIECGQIAFTFDIHQATRFTPEPAAQWLREFQDAFPAFETFEVVERTFLMPKKKVD